MHRRRGASVESRSSGRRRGATIVAAVVAAAVIVVVASWRFTPHFPAPQRRPDVLLITVDTLRADAIGAYGNARAHTPVMDRLAAAGVRFLDAHAQNVITLASHANILSGRYPNVHGVRDNAGFRFPSSVDTLATLLQTNGYRTGAFVSAFPLAARFGLARGFDVYDDRFVDAHARPAFIEQERRGIETVALASRWIAERRGDASAATPRQPWFCWVHIYEPHFPYAPPEPFASAYRSDPYLGEVAAADAALAPLLEPILSSRGQDDVLVMLTADHGESLGEHGEATHGIFAYDATLKVPLIVYDPARFAPQVVGPPVRHVDLLPTILDALSIAPPVGLSGRSVLSLLTDPSAAHAARSHGAEPTYFEALSGNLNRGWAPLRGVIRDGLKFIDLPVPELYDLENDPAERRNLASSRPRELAEMRGLVADLGAAAPRTEAARAETLDTRARLRSLGYVTGSSSHRPSSFTEADDPKRLIELDALLQQVARLYLAGDLQGALASCRQLVERRPTMAVSLIELAHLERESGDLGRAIDALRRAAALNPADTQVVSLLGAYLTQAGRPRDAIDLLEPYARSETPDIDVLRSRALALATAGRHAEARTTLDHARTLEPASAMLRVESGTIALMAGDRRTARAEFEAALALDPNIARAHSSLAVLAAEDGRTSDALDGWKRAAVLDPRELAKLLAFAEYVRGRGGDERPYLELFVASAPPDRYAAEIARARGWLARAR